MRPIDEKIVKMKLDNSDFQSKAAQTVGIFGKLNNAFKKVTGLNFKKPVEDLGKLNSTADKTNLSKLVDGVAKATSGFSVLGTIAFTALQNITNRAVNAGIQMVKSFTMDPIMGGFNEYELKMKSIQTILSNTQGKSNLEDVTKVLDELNTYADKTIYNFADMTSNIGTFTAAGVGLKDSAIAIKGIANLAAASGSNTQQASTAMYQLSQGIANGKVNLQDWNSVVNAGMGGKVFQNALEETAKGLGKGRDMSVSFRDSLQDGWLSTEVLLATLKDFSEDESMLEAATKVRTFTQLVDTAGEALGSGWSQTWEIIFGDFNEAGDMWTKANNALDGIISKSAEGRNKLLGDFVELGGRSKLIDIVVNSFKALTTIIGIASSAFKEVFPPVTAEMLMKLVTGIAEFTKKLIVGGETAEKFKTIFKGIFSIFSIVIQVAKMLGQAIISIIPDGTGGAILDFVARIAELIISFDQGLKGSTKMQGGFKNLHEVVNKVAEGIGKFGSFMGKVFKGSGDILTNMVNIVQPVVTTIAGALKELLAVFTVEDVINGGFIAALIIAVKKFDNIGDLIGDVFDKVMGAIDGVGDSLDVFAKLGDALSAMTASVKAGAVLKIAAAVGILALSLKLIASIDGQDLSKSLTAVGVTMFMLSTALGGIAKSGMGITNAIAASIVLPALAIAVLALSVGLKIIASLDAGELTKGMIGMVGIVIVLVAAVKSLSKVSPGMATSAVGLIGLSIAVVIIASAVEKLSKIKASSLAKGVGAIGVILLELAIFLKIVDKSKLNVGSATAVVIVAAAIHVMVGAIVKIAAIPTESIVKGLVTIGLILAEIAIFVKLTNGAKTMGAAVSMTIISGAINMLVGPIKELGSLSPEVLAKGLGAMAIALGEVVLAMRFAQGGLAGSIGIVAVAFAMNMLVPPLQTLGNMSLEQLAKGLGAMGIGLGIVAIASKVIGVGGAVALLAFAVAVGAVGFAALAISAALAAFATALTILVTVVAVNVDLIITALGKMLVGLLELVPQTVELILAIVTQMAWALAEGSITLAAAAGTMILGILLAMGEYLPQFLTVGMELITNLMNGFADNIGPLIESGVNLMVKLIQGMADAIKNNHVEIVNAVLSVVEAVLLVIIEAMVRVIDILYGWIPGVSETTKNMGDSAKKALDEAFTVEEVGSRRAGEFASGIDGKQETGKSAGANLGNKAKAGAESTEMKTTGTKKGTEFTTGVGNKAGEAQTKGKNLGTKAKSGAGSVSLLNTGNQLGSGFVSGVGSKEGQANTKGRGLGNKAKDGAGSVSLNSSGRNAGEGFAQGISSKGGIVSRAASGLANLAKGALEKVLAIFSPSRVMRKDGGHYGEGFALGIDDKGKRVVDASANMARGAITAVKSYADTFSDALLDNMELNPTITPVLDMANMKTLDMSRRIKVKGTDVSNIDGRNSDGGNQTNVEYNIYVTATGDVPDTTVKKLAKRIQTEIKNQNDRTKLSRGETVVF